MAKMVKCPTCGTPIEVPPQASGQVVKCPGCGKGLKLVAKKSSTPHNPQGSSSSSHGSLSGGSLAGGSVSAMTYQGDAYAPPPVDDMPSLDSNCAVCGNATDPEQLVEDNGKLVCPDCIKGARSYMARSSQPAEILDFASSAASMKRGSVINVGPGFLVAVVAILILIGCQMYLTLITKPVGTAMAKTVKPTEKVAPAPSPENVPDPSTTSPATDPTAAVKTPSDPATQPVAVVPPVASTPATVPSSAVAIATPATTPSTIFEDGPATGTPAVPQVVAPTDNTPPAETVTTADPLDRGIELLMRSDYIKAAPALEQARAKYVVRKLDRQLDSRQILTLEGLAAAYIGEGKPDLAQPSIDLAYQGGDRSRSLVLNRAIVSAVKRTVTLDQLSQAAFDLQSYLQSTPDDEYAAHIMGTLLARISGMPGALREKVDPLWTSLDTYNDRGADTKHPGKLKWGVDLLPADEVKMFRGLRFTDGVPTAGLKQAATDLENANRRLSIAQTNFDRTQKDKGRVADLQGVQNQLEAAKALQEKAQKNFDEASASLKYKKPHWLGKFEPVLPEPPTAK